MNRFNTSSKAVVLGGGSAGWLTALFLKRNWPTLDITVVEDPDRPPIIAGESGTSTFIGLLKHLKIDADNFVRRVNATPKMAGKFTDWAGEGTEFIHALQTDYAPWLDGWTDYDSVPVNQLDMGRITSMMRQERAKDVYLKTIIGNDIPLSKAFYANYFVESNKVPFGPGDKTELPIGCMWHFESRATAAYFKEIGISRGITLVEGKYQEATQDAAGNISSIKLDGDRVLAANWFFDCSGFARLLLEKVMKEPLVDYTDYFPARAVVAWWDDPCYCTTTNATAMKYGWSWNINLRHRSGNGYIYDPDHISLDQAVDEAEKRFNKKIDPIANFQFVPGMMKNFWKKNVFAVGLSSGFIEPLEANGLAIIIETLYAIQDYWNPNIKEYEEFTRQRANDRAFFIADDIKDFLALHYRGPRRDTEFWRSHGNDKFRVPPSLKEKLEEWQEYYALRTGEPYPRAYSATAWIMVMQGIKLFDYDLIANSHKKLLPIGQDVLNTNTQKYKALVDPFWTVEEWIQRTA